MNLGKRVYNVVSRIPPGKVATYGQIARLAGIKNPRQVGWILHRNTEPKHIPCHRVVRSDGTIASGFVFGGPDGQKKILKDEGIKFIAGKIARNFFHLEGVRSHLRGGSLDSCRSRAKIVGNGSNNQR